MVTDPNELLRRALDLTSRLNHYSVLRAFVKSAVVLTGARYSTLSVLGFRGNTAQFVYSGLDSMSNGLIDYPPTGYGFLSEVPDGTYTIRDNPTEESPDPPWPDDHPPMGNFLGVPLVMCRRSFGHPYFTHKDGNFSDDDDGVAMMLARAASIAVENLQLFTKSVAGAQWVIAPRAIPTTLPEDKDEGDVLAFIAYEMRCVARADVILIVLEGVANVWTCEIAGDGGASKIVGVDSPPTGHA